LADVRKEVMGQIRALRRRIDPRLLEKVRDAVYQGEQRSEKDNARAAVAEFLGGLRDGGAFRAKLEAELAAHGKRLDALLPSAVAEPPAPRRRLSDEALLSAPLPAKKTTGKKPADKPAGKSKGFWRRLFE
jgi:hypothetical protein